MMSSLKLPQTVLPPAPPFFGLSLRLRPVSREKVEVKESGMGTYVNDVGVDQSWLSLDGHARQSFAQHRQYAQNQQPLLSKL